jgi:protein-disulfide isomerase
VAFLGQDDRRQAAVALFTELKKAAGFQMLLEEPRVVVEAKGPSRGPTEAKVTIVEFSDFECPYCSRAEESVTQVMDRYAGKVRLVYRHFPLSFHPHAQKAAEAAACADAQGKFWEMHKQLFANQQKLAPDELKGHAAAVGLDAAKFATCLDTSATKALVDADQKVGSEAGVTGTPAFFINGKVLSGAQPFEEFQKAIDAELAKGG